MYPSFSGLKTVQRYEKEINIPNFSAKKFAFFENFFLENFSKLSKMK